jgi:hypothetical protein
MNLEMIKSSIEDDHDIDCHWSFDNSTWYSSKFEIHYNHPVHLNE